MTQSPNTTVHVHQAPSNGMGTAAGVCSILGLVSCGFLCPIGFILGLCSMGKEPKGMAITGVIVGAIGSIGYLIVFLIFGTAVFTMCAGCIGMSNMAAEMAKQQMAADPAADAVIAYYETNGQLPDDAMAATIIAPFKHEGHGFRYEAAVGSNTTFYLEHPGPDGQWDTLDDWQTSWDAVTDSDTYVNPADLPVDGDGDSVPDVEPGDSPGLPETTP